VALLDLVGELTGTLPGLSPILAQTYLNRALRAVYDERLWSFLVTDGVLICPGQINVGTAAVTQGLTTVTADAAASAALQDQITGAALPGILSLQFRPTATPPAASQLYGILAVDNTTPTAVVLTLDRAIVETTNAASQYTIYRALFVPPVADFKTWEAFVDPGNAITLTRNRRTATSADFDRMDPQRTATGLSYWVGAWGALRDAGGGLTRPIPGGTVGQPVYELWPHPTTGQTWYVRIRRAGLTLTNPSDVQPPTIPDNLIVQRALYEHAYPFAAANVANFPSFRGAAWTLLITTARASYRKELIDTKRNDQETQLQSTDNWSRGYGLRSPTPFGRFDVPGYPIDSSFLQSHLIRW
jgi:hypothetical protein